MQSNEGGPLCPKILSFIDGKGATQEMLDFFAF